MRISVVVPLFNKTAHIKSAVMSALGQSHPVHEVIVVDDGSTDGGAQTLSNIDDPRLQVVRQPNAGVSAARNRGISEATGDWISFLDADDWQHPELMRMFCQAHETHRRAEMLGACFLSVPEHCEPQRGTWPPLSTSPSFELVEDLHRRWMLRAPFATSSVAIKADLLHTMQPCFACNEHTGEDLDLWFRVAERTPVVLINQPLAAYRLMPDGLSARFAAEEPPYLQRMQARAQTLELPRHQRASALWFVGQQRITRARAALSAGQRREALAILMKAHGARLTPRWALSVLMALVFPTDLAARWQEYRVRRTHQLMQAGVR